jgi:hypothetical protein
MAQNPDVTEWSGLLESTRLALSTLRLEDLEKLAARAERILETTAVPGPSAKLSLTPSQRRKVLDQQHLLESLLVATDRNLAVLRRLRGASALSRVSGLDSRWVR